LKNVQNLGWPIFTLFNALDKTTGRSRTGAWRKGTII